MLRILGLFCVALALTLSPVAAQSEAPTQSSASSTTETFTLQPGDVIQVRIWREEDLSGEFLVDEFGMVVLPLLGEKRVTGIPMRQLRDLLIEEYSVQLRNPSINIVPLRRVNVLGEVTRPGMYTVDPTISLAGAVALAGGANANGDLNRIRILRAGEVIHERVAAANTLHAADIRSGDQIFVDRRSWWERNSTFVISAALSIPSVAVGIIGLLNLLR